LLAAGTLAHLGDFVDKNGLVDIPIVETIVNSVLEDKAAEGNSVDEEAHILVACSPEVLEERRSLGSDKLEVVDPFVQTLAEVADTG
jgi:hypothetical protein